MMLDSLIANILRLPRFIKILMAIMNDVILCVITVWFAFYLRLGEFIFFQNKDYNSYNLITPTILSLVISLPIFYMFNFYRIIFRHSGWLTLLIILKASIVYAIPYCFLITIYGFDGVPRTIGIIQPTLLFLAIGGSRAVLHFWLSGSYSIIKKKHSRKNTLVYGAGDAGRQLVSALYTSGELKVVGFLDDNIELQGSSVNGLYVYDPSKIVDTLENLIVNQLILALPSASRARRSEIVERMRHLNIPIYTLPSITALANGKLKISDIRDLDIDDLLGRLQVDPNEELIKRDVYGKIILVSGAGGSIGKELSKQILNAKPNILLLVEQSEHSLYLVNQELIDLNKERTTKIFPLLCSINNVDRINDIISRWRPEIIFHAAAYKHVPLVEHNPAVSIYNNVYGTLSLAQAAEKYKVKKFILISSDKAVRPTNIMGATKRLSEMILQAFAEANSVTIFSMVRFGNVLDSSGSVVPQFREQIKNGGPVTITHPDITRYFMTITEAVHLVLQAGTMAMGGEVFLLDMGKPVKIIDLAYKMIQLSGLSVRNTSNPFGDIEIKVIGLRPGEKLYEELLIGNDAMVTEHPLILKSKETYLDKKILLSELDKLQFAINNNAVQEIHNIFKRLIAGYFPVNGVVDWLSSENNSAIDNSYDDELINSSTDG